MKEISYVMIKPEFANSEKVIDYVLSRLENAGLDILEAGYVKYSIEDARKHYVEHYSKFASGNGAEFYPELEQYITSDKAYGMKVAGEDAIATIRKIVGATKNPEPGTIRHDVPEMLNLPRRITQNVVHASDCIESAETELAIFESLRNK